MKEIQQSINISTYYFYPSGSTVTHQKKKKVVAQSVKDHDPRLFFLDGLHVSS